MPRRNIRSKNASALNKQRLEKCRMEQKQRLLQLFNCTDPLPGTANSTLNLRATVLEIQAIMLGIVEPHGRFRFDITGMAQRHPFPWRKFVSTVIHESLHCAARTVRGAPDRQINCAAMVSLNPDLVISEEFVELKGEIVDAFPFLAEIIDVVD
uniref:BHLH domain-containing protein n=1 Tax=Globodera pallida TaxID=36090 RepID=A0A183CP38_GLOPA